MKVLAAREVGYAIIDLGSENAPSSLNDEGEVLLLRAGSQNEKQVGSGFGPGTWVTN